MHIWLDDLRNPQEFEPGVDYLWVKDAESLIFMLREGYEIDFISFDNDLGEGVLEGYDVAKCIEGMAFWGEISRIGWKIHSANPVAKTHIYMAMSNADTYWGEKENV